MNKFTNPKTKTTNSIVTAALHRQEAASVRERIIQDDAQGSMVVRRLLWLLGKIDLGNHLVK